MFNGPLWSGLLKAEEVNVTRRRTLPVWTKFYGVITGGYGFDEDTDEDKYDPLSSSSVPSFWASQSDEYETEFGLGFICKCLVGIVFGAIHCAAWNTGFPTAEEMWIWRSCSLSVTASPILWPASVLLTQVFDFPTVLEAMLTSLLILIYVLTRIPLLFIAFMMLRSLSPAAFTDVNWSVYIPHL
ncbi:hypothetical protein B0H14DRAFT_3135270 [Mycena olivaceomarginata]|nr:hypothetical protein B0H14DRAFT_3135270 [Mycena olivaceomarginata]